jgi:2Fe-2S ferredoxin
MPRVTFLPLHITLECREGESVFDVGRRANIPIPTACVGKATCGLCRVKVVSGEEHLPPVNADEVRHLGNTYFITKLRLACQALVTGGDVTVVIPELRVRKG